MIKHYHAATAASLLSCPSGGSRDRGCPCAIVAMRAGTPVPPPPVPAAKMVSTDARAVRAGQGKKTHLDQKTHATTDLVKVVKVVRAKITTPHACARARVYRILSYSLYFSIKENTLTTLTKSITAGFFALTKHPDQA